MRHRLHRTLTALAALGAIPLSAGRAVAQAAPSATAAGTAAARDGTTSEASVEVAALQRQALLDHSPMYPDLRVPRPGTVRVDFDNESERVMLLRPPTLPQSADHDQGVAYRHTITSTQRLCATPCTLFVPPGATTLRVSSFAQRGTDDELFFVTPIDGARVRIRGGSDDREVAAQVGVVISTLVSLGGLFGLLYQGSTPDPDPAVQAETMWILGGVALVGTAFSVATVAMGMYAATAVVRVAPLRPRRSRVAFGGAVVAPDAASRGGRAALAFTF